jgi:hypothetical protein
MGREEQENDGTDELDKERMKTDEARQGLSV